MLKLGLKMQGPHTPRPPLRDAPVGAGPDGAGTHETAAKGVAFLVIALPHGGSDTLLEISKVGLVQTSVTIMWQQCAPRLAWGSCSSVVVDPPQQGVNAPKCAKGLHGSGGWRWY